MRRTRAVVTTDHDVNPVSGAYDVLLLAVALGLQDGDLRLNPDNTIAGTTPVGDELIAYEPPANSAVTTSARARMAAAKPPRQPDGYPEPQSTFLPELPMMSKLLAQISQNMHSDLAESGACVAIPNIQRALADMSDPKNPAYYQIQLYCGAILGQPVTPTNVIVTFSGAPFNNASEASSMQYQQQNCSQAAGIDPDFHTSRFFCAWQRIPVVSGHPELNAVTGLQYDVSYKGTSYTWKPYVTNMMGGAPPRLLINNRAVPYPVVAVQPSWGPATSITPGGNVAFPLPLSTVWWTPFAEAPPCKPAKFSALASGLRKANIPSPGPGFQAHHIQPVSWCGSNDIRNGIWLPTTTPQPVDLHTKFTTWFREENFKP